MRRLTEHSEQNLNRDILNRILFSFLGLERTIHEANLTFINTVNLWNDIYEQFPAIQDAAVKFQNVTEKGESHTDLAS